MATGGAQAPLLTDVVQGSIDFKTRPATRSKTGRWKSASFIIGVELAERISYFGMNSNLITYLTGPLAQSTAAAAANVNTWSATAWLLPLLGGFIADSILGKYRMIITATLFYILGLGFLSLSAALHSDCINTGKTEASCSPPQLEIIFFFLSLYLTALAQGGNKPCVLAFAADQFDDEDPNESKLKSSLFNWWNFTLSILTMLAVIVLNYVQDNLGWELSFGILCIIMGLALLVFLFGTMNYRFPMDGVQRTPLVNMYQIIVNAAKSWMTKNKTVSVPGETEPIQPCEDAQLRFRDKEYMSEDVEPTKAVLGLVSIWSTCLGFSIIHSQVSTLFVKQAATLDRHITPNFQIPSASIQSFLEGGFIIFIPIYDRILVPIARGLTKKPSGISMLQRIGTGLFLSLVGMIIAALVERRRLAVAHDHGLVDVANATLPMSVWWLAPQDIVFGVGDAFILVGLQEFFYDQVPNELKSIGIALYLSVVGVGHLLSSFVIYMVVKFTGQDGWLPDNLNGGHLDYFYWLLCGIGTLSFAAYLYFAKSYVYRRRSGSIHV